MIKRIYLLLSLVVSITLAAQPDPAYYQSAIGKSDKELKTALHNIIKVGSRLSYGSGTWSGFEKSDLRPDGYVWDMYSTNLVKFPGNGKAPDGMNIEHSVAKSWWGSAKNDAYKDLYHLNPSNSNANSARSNYPLGTNNGSKFNNNAIKVGNNTSNSEYTGLCFEPLDEYKGDFARAYLYMFTCYENLSWTGNAPTMLVTSETWPMLKPWAKELLLTWSRQDPVSEKEINRSNAIFELQHNRNPFIDYPELVEYLWGDRQGQPFSIGDVDYPYLSMPTSGYTVNFGTVAYQQSATSEITIKGHNLTADLTLSLSGDNSSFFSLPTSSISKEDAEEGYRLVLTYNATNVGNHNAILTISGGGITSKTISVKAISSDDFMALPASSVSNTSFVANWTVSANASGYELDVFKMDVSGEDEMIEIIAEGFTDNQLPSGWNEEGGVYYVGTDNVEGVVRLASGSKNGSLIIPNLDLSEYETVLTVMAKRYGSDSNAQLTVSLNGSTIAQWKTEADFKSYTVNLPAGNANSTLTLSASKGQRVYIDSVNISTEGEVPTKVSIEGYPITLGNMLSHQVEGLEADETYYYSLTPQGNNKEISNVVEVRTSLMSNVDNVWKEDRIYSVSTSGGVAIYNLTEGSQIEVYNLLGKSVFKANTISTSAMIPLSQKGIYLINVSGHNSNAVVKVIF